MTTSNEAASPRSFLFTVLLLFQLPDAPAENTTRDEAMRAILSSLARDLATGKLGAPPPGNRAACFPPDDAAAAELRRALLPSPSATRSDHSWSAFAAVSNEPARAAYFARLGGLPADFMGFPAATDHRAWRDWAESWAQPNEWAVLHDVRCCSAAGRLVFHGARRSARPTALFLPEGHSRMSLGFEIDEVDEPLRPSDCAYEAPRLTVVTSAQPFQTNNFGHVMCDALAPIHHTIQRVVAELADSDASLLSDALLLFRPVCSKPPPDPVLARRWLRILAPHAALLWAHDLPNGTCFRRSS